MSAKTMEELLNAPINSIIIPDKIALDLFSKENTRKPGKWEIATAGHPFKLGEVYVIEDCPGDISGFKSYIRRAFQLGVTVAKKEGKAYCLVRPLRETVRKKKRLSRSKAAIAARAEEAAKLAQE